MKLSDLLELNPVVSDGLIRTIVSMVGIPLSLPWIWLRWRRSRSLRSGAVNLGLVSFVLLSGSPHLASPCSTVLLPGVSASIYPTSHHRIDISPDTW